MLLAIEIGDVPFAIRQKDVPWVRRFLNSVSLFHWSAR